MDNLVRAFTTRQPAIGPNGTTLQRNITIYVLVAGIAGGLLLVLAILLLCKYCSRSRPRSDASTSTVRLTVSKGAGPGAANNNCHLAGTNSNSEIGYAKESPETVVNFACIRTPEVSVALSSAKTQHQQQQQRSASNGANKTSPTLASAPLPGPLQQPTGVPMETSSSANQDDSDSYVIQVEPVRIVSASPTSPIGGVDSWCSPDDSARDCRLRPEDWRNDDVETLDGGQASVSNRHNKRSLRHAASHPSARDAPGDASTSAVCRRRLEWRNSHRNYRSTPTTSGSRDAGHYASGLNYETRRALRDYHQQHVQAEQPSFDSYAGRRMLPKRGGSVREAPSSPGKELMASASAPDAQEASNPALCPSSASSAAHIRCQMITSPATKRWRCHTLDCPCSNNVSAPAVPHDLIDTAAVAHRHSFPSSGAGDGGSTGQSGASGHNQRHHYHHHHRDERTGNFSGARSKDVYYSGSYLDRSESLDWAGFQPSVSPGASSVIVGGGASSASGAGSVVRGDDDDVSSLITDDDDEATGVPMQSSAPRITIRYNDPGSLESVNEENLFFCLDADNKKEFRQRLEKTIHAQYRQVWELRANLEEHTEFYEHPSSPEPELNPDLLVNFAGEVEMPILDQTSFDSNSEAPADEEEDDDSSYTIPDSPAKNAMPPNGSGLWKRQSYRSIAMNARLRRQTGLPQMSLPVSQQAQSSFDSVDTIETSSTDASRLEQMTTSFESSATDSTNGTETAIVSSHPPPSHRLLSARDDSGYRSIESSGLPQRMPSKTSPTFNADEITSDVETSPLRPGEQSCQCRGDVHDEKCERNKPVVFARCTRYGLKARSASTQNPPTSSASWRQQQRLHQHRSHQILTRDYSIDERTDAIFREFTRCDPVYYETGKSTSRKDLRQGFNHRARWMSQHQRHDPQHQHRFMSFQDGASLAPEPSDALLHCTLKE